MGLAPESPAEDSKRLYRNIEKEKRMDRKPAGQDRILTAGFFEEKNEVEWNDRGKNSGERG